jgi:hypothetical protein
VTGTTAAGGGSSTAVPVVRRSGLRARLAIYRKPVLVGLSAAGYVLLAWLLLIVPTAKGFNSFVGFDSYAYWAVSPFHPYDAALGTVGSFTYSPAAALVFAPASLVPFNWFYLFWASFLIVNLVWLTRRYALVWLCFLPVSLELYHGNVHLLLATVCVLGFRYPALWSIALLTKVTPGVSLLWFVVRREWRSLEIALGATAAIVAVSFVVAPGAWFDWVKFLTSSNATGATANDSYGWIVPPLWLRMVAAAILVVWGARTDRRWVVPVASVIALPVLWITGPAMLVAIPRLRKPAAGRVDATSDRSAVSLADAEPRPA